MATFTFWVRFRWKIGIKVLCSEEWGSTSRCLLWDLRGKKKRQALQTYIYTQPLVQRTAPWIFMSMEVTAASKKANSAIISPLVWDQTQEKKPYSRTFLFCSYQASCCILCFTQVICLWSRVPGHLIFNTWAHSSDASSITRSLVSTVFGTTSGHVTGVSTNLYKGPPTVINEACFGPPICSRGFHPAL